MFSQEPREWFAVIMDLFKTKQSQDIKKKKTKRAEIIKSFENIFVTYLIFKKSPICLIGY